MKNLIKPIALFISAFIIIISVFGLTFDVNYPYAKSELNNKKQAIYSKYLLDDKPVDTTRLYIDNIYTEMVINEFVQDAVDNGLDKYEVIEHMKALDAIVLDDLSEIGMLGVTVYIEDSTSATGLRGIIILNEKMLQDPELFKLTLYHELGHWFGLPHCGCENSIMMDGYKTESVNKILKHWNRSVRNLMKDIDKGYDVEKGHYDFPDMIYPDTTKTGGFRCEHH